MAAHRTHSYPVIQTIVILGKPTQMAMVKVHDQIRIMKCLEHPDRDVDGASVREMALHHGV